MLTDVIFKNQYTTGYDEPKVFFTEALIESKTFDLGLGFFSSSGICSLAYGFAIFIARGGKMRVIMNHILSEQDKIAIENGKQKVIDDFENTIICDIQKLSKTLSKADTQFFRCLSYLISIERIEFVATISAKGGLGHDKYGIFTDAKGNKVAFIGSANFSKTAMELNGETITVFQSPIDDQRIYEYQKIFNESWIDDTPHLIHIPIEKVTSFLRESFHTESINDIINSGISLRELSGDEFNDFESSISFPDELVKKMEFIESEPRFPFPNERQIQIDAYQAWIDNDNKGIFAMATGAGKTVTALNCIFKQYQKYGFYKAVIVVPTQTLAIQWEHEASSFNFQNIVSTHTNKDWKQKLEKFRTKSLLNSNRNIIIITTYATFNKADIQLFIEKVKGIESFIYIADEAHNLGSKISLAHMPIKIYKRIGLSATPERVYDEIGSKQLYDFFNSMPPRYTYRYTMKQAIDDNILCHYDYYPVFVELTMDEMEEYKKITKQLVKFIDSETGKYKEDAEKLLLKRKRIIYKAERKKTAILKLLTQIEEVKNLDYTFVFVPEGYENHDYSDSDITPIKDEELHLINEYAQMFKDKGYTYHKYISGLEDAPSILKSFTDGNIQILLSMKCLDEGVDIPRAENAIFCSSTGNPRQFVQRRGRILRKHKNKKKATIWDLIVKPPSLGTKESQKVETQLFTSEVRRVLNFAALADNKIDILYGDLKSICEQLDIDMFQMLEEEYQQYN